MKKAELRKIYLAKRQGLSEIEYERLNQGLCDRFFSVVDFHSIRVVHTFLPVPKFREPNTWLILKKIQTDFTRVQVSVPRVNANTGELVNFFFEGRQQLAENSWGVLEPTGGTVTPAEKIDVVIVPLVAFDKKGYRVGYGKGYYDRFLSTCRADCLTVGINFFSPVDSIDDIDWYDKKLEMVITPENLFRF